MSQTPAAPVIGFVGLGAIGRPIAEKLRDHGLRMVVHDILPERTEGFAETAGSAADVAGRSDIVFACLPSIASYKSAALGPGGLVEGGKPVIYVHLGTTGAAVFRELEAALEKRGLRCLDAPITGGAPRARLGTLTSIVSGPSAAFERCADAISSYASKIVYLGPQSGAAQLLKLINNMLSATNLAIAAEVLVLGAKAGLTPAQMLEVLNEGTGQNSATLTKVPDHILTRRFDYGGSMEITLKDTLAFLAEAEALGLVTPVSRVVRQVYLAAAEAGARDGDMTEVIRHMEAQAGVEVS